MKTPPLLLTVVLLASLVAISALSANAQTNGQTNGQTREISTFAPLRNRDVLMMVEKHFPASAIITIIRFSSCNFDTFPPILLDLKNRGVPGGVLQAMIEAPYGPSTETRNNTDRAGNDDTGEEPIYHYAEQLRLLGFLSPVTNGRRLSAARRTRASRRQRR